MYIHAVLSYMQFHVNTHMDMEIAHVYDNIYTDRNLKKRN